MGEDVNSDPKRRPADYREFEPEYMPYEWSDGDGGRKSDDRQINVDELIGTYGERLELSEDVVEYIRLDEESMDPDKPVGDINLNARAVRWADEAFRDPPEAGSTESFEAGAMRILHRLARRMAPAASDAFRESLEQLMEPVRTVAVTTFIQSWSHEATAQQLGCSVQTVDFLVEVALSHLEGLVEFHVPRPRPRNRMLDSVWEDDFSETGLD